MAKLFSHVEGVASFHEPFPIMNNVYGNAVDKEKELDEEFRLKKLIIKRAASGHSHYIETNHQFIKSFSDRAIKEFGKKIKIIHLVREAPLVAKSFYQIGSIPGKTSKGKSWLLDPSANENIISLPELSSLDGEYSHDFYKCLWYWYEVEARINHLKLKHKDIFMYKIHTEELSSRDKISEMFTALGIDIDADRLHYYAGYRSNLKISKKSNNIGIEDIYQMNSNIKRLISCRTKNEI